MVNQTARSHQETIEFAILIKRLYAIVKTADYVVTTRSLTTRKDDTYVDSLIVLALSRNELYYGHTISIGEKSLDFFLVTNALCSGTFHSLYSTLKSLRQLRLISCSCNLQCTFFHCLKKYLNCDNIICKAKVGKFCQYSLLKSCKIYFSPKIFRKYKSLLAYV